MSKCKSFAHGILVILNSIKILIKSEFIIKYLNYVIFLFLFYNVFTLIS